LKSILNKSTPNPVCGFVDNSLAKNRQRTGPLAVDKSQKTATYPPRDPLPTSSTDHLGFDMQFESQNQTLRLIPLLEWTLPGSVGMAAALVERLHQNDNDIVVDPMK
jgi:hypothetical protein